MKKQFVSSLLLLIALLTAPLHAADEVRIGVLAKRGAVETNVRWLGHSLLLAPKLGKTVTFVPLEFTEVDEAAAKGSVDFLFVNSSMFVVLQDKYGAEPIATMVNQSKFHKKTTLFGGVVITSAKSADIDKLEDVKGRAFYAVKKNSLGGYQAALKEFLDKGIDLDKEAGSVTFLNTHDAVVNEVVANPGTLGTVRTDTLERMISEGKLGNNEIKVINQRQAELDFPFLLSTSLYPEWPMAKLPKADQGTTDALAKALMEVHHNDLAGRSANIAGWGPPERYDSVRLLQQAIGATEVGE